MIREGYPAQPEPTFPTITIPEVEVSYLLETKKLTTILDLLKERGLYSPDSLYGGIDTEPLQRTGSFGDQQETWGLTESEFRAGVVTADKYGNSHFTHNPIYYASTDGLYPAVVVYKKPAFVNLGNEGIHTEIEWRLKPGQTMDEAIRAVIYFS